MITIRSGRLRWLERAIPLPEKGWNFGPTTETVLQMEWVDQIGRHVRWEDVPTEPETTTTENKPDAPQ